MRWLTKRSATRTSFCQIAGSPRCCPRGSSWSSGQRGFWATRYKVDEVGRCIEQLNDLVERLTLDPDVDARAELHIVGLLSAIDRGPGTEGAARAQRLLDTRISHLRPVERFQLNVFACGGDGECLRKRLPELLRELASLRAESGRSTQTASARFYRLGQAFQMVGPTFADLATAGHVDDGVRLVAAWAEDPDVPPRVKNPLVAVVAYPGGTLWATEGNVLAPPESTNRSGSMASVVKATNRFLNTRIVFRDQDVDLAPLTGDPGLPVTAAGADFLAVVREHLRTAPLKDLHIRPSNLVAVPTFPIPVQALLVNELGWTPAMSISLREPASRRQIRSVVLLGDGETTTSTWELDVVEGHFSGAGARVHRPESTRASFIDAYLDSEVDVLWVASHGHFDHFRPDESVLRLNSGEELSIDELVALEVPDLSAQRLLVLNAGPLSDHSIDGDLSSRETSSPGSTRTTFEGTTIAPSVPSGAISVPSASPASITRSPSFVTSSCATVRAAMRTRTGRGRHNGAACTMSSS